MISILAPLTGSDKTQPCHQTPYAYFNPRSPHRERRVCRDVYAPLIKYFNPRSPHRERQRCRIWRIMHINFNPRSPHRERPLVLHPFRLPKIFQSTLPSQGATFSSPSVQASQNISIHAPLTGSDLEHVVTYGGIWISIHAPLTGSDAYTFQTLRFGYNFNPRSPHRERRMKNSGSS